MTYRYAELAARVLAHANDRRSARPLGARVATVAAMEAALEGRAARARRRLWFVRLVAASAAAATVIGMYRLVAHVPQRQLPSASAPTSPASADVSLGILAHPSGAGAAGGLAEGAHLGPGSRVAANPGGRVDLAFSTGTHLVVEEGGELAIVEGTQTQLFRLERGSVQAHVARLSGGERFVVKTPDAEVEVRGTSFRVAVVAPNSACGNDSRTRVHVSTGHVAIRTSSGEAVLGPGETWPQGCPGLDASEFDRPRIAPAAPNASTRPSRAPGTTVPKAEPGPEPEGPLSGPTSALAEVNDRFADAMMAKRQGRIAQAIDLFEQIETRYPSSTLAENAMVEQMRMLRTSDPARAGVLAGRYLARYPNGFARTEAEALRRSTAVPR